MKHVAIAALLLVLIPLQAAALDTTELLGLVAMPLAVAAVSEVTGVPAGELSNLVATLNRANVPPTQVVQVIRYAPAALVVETQQPTFVQFVDAEFDRGITGTQLVSSIDQRLRTYEVTPQFITLTEPATTFVISDDYIPPVVVARVAQLRPATAPAVIGDTNDLLALIAMPLAVNAVSQLTGMPLDQLSTLVATLNGANVAPVQVIEVLRYAPIALVVDDEPQFVQFVTTQVANGVTGLQLVNVIEQRFRAYDVSPQLASSSVVVVDENFIPPVVVRRVAEARRHPHGGPPGQLKKIIGVQTGAEVVHGSRARVADRAPVVKERKETRVIEDRRVKDTPPGQRKKVERSEGNRGRQNAPPVVVAQPAPPAQSQGQGRGQGQKPGQGKGKGKGKG